MCRLDLRAIVSAGRRRAFTLIELLVVVAIIAMLIGIVMPGLGHAKDQAKKVRTQALMKAAGDGLEMFVGENEEECAGQNYPPSSNHDDPTEEKGGDSTTGEVALGDEQIFGCQWLVRYLMGKNLDGYVPRRNVPKVFQDLADGDMGWTQKSWYDSNASGTGGVWPANFPQEPLPRVGPYMTNPPIKMPRDIVKLNAPLLVAGSTESKLPKYSNWVLVDTFNYPIMYYAAKSSYANRPDAIQTTYKGEDKCPGIYNWYDNSLFTGLTTMETDGTVTPETPQLKAWDFGSGPHKLTYGPAAWKSQAPGSGWREIGQRKDVKTQPFSFAYMIMNRQAFEASYTQSGQDATKATIVPARKDSFILMSPGKDGLFGTSDDIVNW